MTRRNTTLFAMTAVMVGCLPDYPSTAWERGSPYGDSHNGMSPSDDPSGPGSGSGTATGPQPELGATVRQADPPPPLSGGTIAVAPDGETVVAADPDRDLVYLVGVGVGSPAGVRTIALSLHDEPGRVAIDASNRAHVALRNGGALVSIDIATATVIERREACSSPRGVAYDAAADVVHVACAGGELVTFPATGGAEVKRRSLELDLRDVAVLPGGLAISTFRDAKILRLDPATDAFIEVPAPSNPAFGVQRVAWRMIAAPPRHEGDEVEVMVAAQKAPDSGPEVLVPSVPAEYYRSEDSCSATGPGPIIRDRHASVHVPSAVLPVDVAARADTIVLAAAGNGHTPSLPQLVFVARQSSSPATDVFSCTAGQGARIGGAQITSVAFARGGSVVVALSREPAVLVVVDATTRRETSRISLSTVSREDTGHAIFHSNSGVGVACASCHPDGRDDGHAWRSLELGPRRTPSLLGTLAGTAPYHWNGEAKDLSDIVRLTFQSRMRGPVLTGDRIEAMNGWLGSLRAPPPAKVAELGVATRGKALFEGAGNCTQCHSGPMWTNNETVNARTGGVFQIPSLVGVAWRFPLLHDGSAPTIRALLERDHGEGKLKPGQLDDLTAYVETF